MFVYLHTQNHTDICVQPKSPLESEEDEVLRLQLYPHLRRRCHDVFVDARMKVGGWGSFAADVVGDVSELCFVSVLVILCRWHSVTMLSAKQGGGVGQGLKQTFTTVTLSTV